ncbi:DUF2218 domain-containing protein [Azospirillum melinis]|uniref:DUF2218 domain-containing protein n=1 Tax=Azospirillum melinis TaxID=328839 RepID=A0ABX2KMF8_9PROT|nr:DUF2218 domain-containing protein [Azospirillum melinis]MBP2309319.1 hypothetical protein [Azospirillum melinis]NUB03921.1 DUF2218 domain-containing protein [Azospirillum melinis]
MAASTARIATPNGRRYMTQLCKHWAHKFEVVYDETQGLVPFAADRRCRMAADDAGLTLTIEIEDAGQMERMQEVVIDHLKRFAFREETLVRDLGEVVWTPVG